MYASHQFSVLAGKPNDGQWQVFPLDSVLGPVLFADPQDPLTGRTTIIRERSSHTQHVPMFMYTRVLCGDFHLSYAPCIKCHTLNNTDWMEYILASNTTYTVLPPQATAPKTLSRELLLGTP